MAPITEGWVEEVNHQKVVLAWRNPATGVSWADLRLARALGLGIEEETNERTGWRTGWLVISHKPSGFEVKIPKQI